MHAHRYGPDRDSGAQNCRHITGGTELSIHAFWTTMERFVFWNGIGMLMACAVDIRPTENPYSTRRLITTMTQAMVDAIEAIRTIDGIQVWEWGGDWNNNNRADDPPFDPMHFQLTLTPAQLARGIDWRTVHGVRPPTPPTVLPGKAQTVALTFTLPTLRPGAKGPHVERLGRLLNEYANQHVDWDAGAYDEAYVDAVNNVKRLLKLKPDGVCGPRVWQFLGTQALGKPTTTKVSS
jgi:hypothetical protein